MSNNLPIYVVSIMKNESAFIERWYNSFKDEMQEGDMAVLLDTGSEDGSYELAESLGITVYKKVYKDWSFAVARNDLREMLPNKDAWVLSLDVDEVLLPGWREQLKTVPMQVNRPRYRYTWNWLEKVFNPDGSVNIPETVALGKVGLEYHGDKIVRRHSHKWVNRVHEVNVPAEGQPELQGFTQLRIVHFADDKKSRSSYLPLLLLDVEENPMNDRNVYYAGRELMYYGRAEESIAMLKKHLALPTAVWRPERGYSCRWIAKQSTDPSEREMWLIRGAAEYPWGRELWVELAQHYASVNNWVGSFHAAVRACNITDRGNLYLTEAVMWGSLPHDLLALAAARLQIWDTALDHGKKAVEANPDDQRLRNNLAWYKFNSNQVTVIIPTKSNLDNLTVLVASLMKDKKVGKIIVVADGIEAYKSLGALPKSVIKLMVPESSGIHAMWNMGMSVAGKGLVGQDNAIAFLNDDITIADNCMSDLFMKLCAEPSYGLVCPTYAHIPETQDRLVLDVCRSRYDGSGGMAGFCMMLAPELAHWRWDERMKFYYGDDLLVRFVDAQGKCCVITPDTWCKHDDSYTFRTNPPKNWDYKEDERIYKEIVKKYD